MFLVAVKLLKSGYERNEMVIKTDSMVMNRRFLATVCVDSKTKCEKIIVKIL